MISNSKARRVTILIGATTLSAAIVAVMAAVFPVPGSWPDDSPGPDARAETQTPVSETPPPDLHAVGANTSWWQAVTGDIARAEYAATPAPGAGLQAPNRAQNLRTTFGERGIEVVPRTGKDAAPAWRFAWQTNGIGRKGRMDNVGPASPESEGSRVRYRRDGWSEWYENTAKGLEQGFTIDRRPAGEGPLQIAGKVPGGLEARAREDGAIDFLDDQGACVIRYGAPRAWDAKGMAASSKLLVAGAELSIVIDDQGAEYPLTVDPLMTSPAWTAESDQAQASFGLSVGTAGDVNGDGFSDVIVGSYLFDNGQTDEGRAFVYHGSAGGLSVTPSWTAESDQASAQFGFWVATAGDVNGDGFSDVIVAAIRYDNGEIDEGRAYVYHGAAGGLSPTPSWTAESDQTGALFGLPVATAGDVNGDGFSDVIVGAFQYDHGQNDEGRAFVYHGSAGGLSLTPSWTAESDQADCWFGSSVATAGDVNGDAYSDVIVGAYHYSNGQTWEGRAFVYHGSSAGLATTAAWTGESDQAGAAFGYSVGTAGDVNGDGFCDVIVGAQAYGNGQSGEGRAFVYHGSSAGLALSPAWTAESDQAAANFGTSVATAGDVNGDGFADVIVGAHQYDNGQTNEGRAYLYQGSAAGLAASAGWTAESDQASALFGYSVATAGDVNGDGYSDVIVGAYGYGNGQSGEGRAFAYHGAAAGLALSAAWTAESNQDNAHYGSSVATAGDVNGDGFSDVIVGADDYDNGQADEGRSYVYHGSPAGLVASPAWTAEGDQDAAQFGVDVATAGDVNGDGYSDVIVGAHFYTNGQDSEGRAYVYHGSSSGLFASPQWIAEGDQALARFGIAVATAGDVNGDGFSDVIVGADFYSNGQSNEGRAFVYHGSPDGLAPSPAWTAESDQAGAFFGGSVATAGDVNGDGFSDVIIGAGRYDNDQTNEGRAYVYLGSPAGLATSPAWTVESDQEGTYFGLSVGTAGDVNGDGFSDVIVGAMLYDNGQSDEGQAFVYLGSPAGLETSASWTADSDQAIAFLGRSVETAGDVNGDGFSDVIIGAYSYDNGESEEGRSYVYLGSPAGLATSPSWTAEGDQGGAFFGYSGGTAGDVNGDGFSDVVVGAYNYDNVQQTEGRAFVYYGNNGDGLHRVPNQLRTDGAAPIQALGLSDSPTAFRLDVLGRTPAGRGAVQLQYEVEPFGTPFDGAGVVTGPALDTGVPAPGTGSAVPLSELAGVLTAETLYHWRLRIVADSPFFPRSPWFSAPGNAASEADLRTAEATTGVAESEAPPAPRLLEAPRPNPFGRTGEIAYTLPRSGRVRLAVYDVAGREVALLVDRMQQPGGQVATWDGRGARGEELPAGVYFARLVFQRRMEVQKFALAP